MATNIPAPKEGGREHLFLTLLGLGIKTETYHYQNGPGRNGLRGIFCKNLFLKDRKGQFYLIICSEDKTIDLKELKARLHAHRNFSFGSPEDLFTRLGTAPGAVTPLGLLFDSTPTIRVIIEQRLANSPDTLLNFHPLTPDETTLISFANLNKFMKHTGHSLEILELT